MLLSPNYTLCLCVTERENERSRIELRKLKHHARAMLRETLALCDRCVSKAVNWGHQLWQKKLILGNEVEPG